MAKHRGRNHELNSLRQRKLGMATIVDLLKEFTKPQQWRFPLRFRIPHITTVSLVKLHERQDFYREGFSIRH